MRLTALLAVLLVAAPSYATEVRVKSKHENPKVAGSSETWHKVGAEEVLRGAAIGTGSGVAKIVFRRLGGPKEPPISAKVMRDGREVLRVLVAGKPKEAIAGTEELAGPAIEKSLEIPKGPHTFLVEVNPGKGGVLIAFVDPDAAKPPVIAAATPPPAAKPPAETKPAPPAVAARPPAPPAAAKPPAPPAVAAKPPAPPPAAKPAATATTAKAQGTALEDDFAIAPLTTAAPAAKPTPAVAPSPAAKPAAAPAVATAPAVAPPPAPAPPAPPVVAAPPPKPADEIAVATPEWKAEPEPLPVRSVVAQPGDGAPAGSFTGGVTQPARPTAPQANLFLGARVGGAAHLQTAASGIAAGLSTRWTPSGSSGVAFGFSADLVQYRFAFDFPARRSQQAFTHNLTVTSFPLVLEAGWSFGPVLAGIVPALGVSGGLDVASLSNENPTASESQTEVAPSLGGWIGFEMPMGRDRLGLDVRFLSAMSGDEGTARNFQLGGLLAQLSWKFGI